MPSNNSQQTNQSSSNPAPATTKQPTRYSIVKQGWGGSRTNFQHSYGLRSISPGSSWARFKCLTDVRAVDPEGIEEGNAILDAMIQNDLEAERK